jgi:hypothetical protein
MKYSQLFNFLALISICTGLNAQITVTNAGFPAVNDSVFYAFDANSNPIHIITPPGGNQSWDLSGLQVNQTGTTVYRNPNMGVQSGNFPGAELLVIESGREMYYDVTSDKVELMGYFGADPYGLGINLLIPYLPPIADRHAPLQFFDIHQQSSSILVAFRLSELPANVQQQLIAGLGGNTPDSIRIRIATNRLDVVDAWGNLSIPGGCYEVLREQRTTYTEKRLDAKIAPLGWLDVTDNAVGQGFTTLGVDTTKKFHFFSLLDKQEIAVLHPNNHQNAIISVRFKHPDNSQFSISNIATSPEICPNANNGSITVTTTGGTGILTYAISGPVNQNNGSGVFTNLPDGNYNIIVTSSNSPCQVPGTATVAAGVDMVPPELTCPANQSLILGANCTATLPNYTGMATASDNCGIPVITQSPASGTSVVGAGNLTVTLTATDANNNTSQCSFIVNKIDNTAPTISCPAMQILPLGANCSAAMPNYTTLATANDACNILSITQSPAAGMNVSGSGNLMVTLTATDVNNNTAQCTFTVVKVDNTAPSIICPSTQTLALGANCSATLPNYTLLATTGDNCSVFSVTQSPALGTAVSNAGNMTLSLTVTDLNNNTSQCSFTVIKADNTPPTVTCINSTLNFNGQQSISLNANEVVNTTDNCGLQSISLIPNQILANQAGQTVPVMVTVTDNSNNMLSCTANISVSGLPPGWSQEPDGIGCNSCTSEFDFNFGTGIWTGSSTGFFYGPPYTSDAIAFASRSLCGNGSITAQVTEINGTSQGWAGVVMRESLAGGAKKAQLTTNLGGNQNRREFRLTTNGAANPQNSQAQNRYWLRAVRSGNQFLLYNSPNGTQWYLVGAQTIVMSSCIQMGLLATNYNSSSTVNATFANVSYTGLANLPPSQTHVDVSEVTFSDFQPNFSVYPNPTAGELNIDMREYIGKNVQIELYSLEGKLMQLIQLDEILQSTQTLLLDRYASGMYFVKLSSAGLPDVTKRIVLTKA